MAHKRTEIDNVPVKYRNFAGVKTDKNREGDSNFEIVIDEEIAKNMMADLDEHGIGWYIKTSEYPDKTEYRIKLRLGQLGDPLVYVIGEDGKAIKMNRGQWKRIDKMTISFVDVIFHQSNKTFEYQGREYYSAYVDELYVNIVESNLQKKYGITPDYPDDNLPELDD